MRFTIHQLPVENPKCFRGYDSGDNKHLNYPPGYKRVYEGKIKNTENKSKEGVLEDLYYIFNMKHPSDYRARSLSVSDVVTLDGKSFYCDDIGWKGLEDGEVKLP